VARRQMLWARQARADLREAMGGVCCHCGSGENLEFDCIVPTGDYHHKLGVKSRVSFYRQQWLCGNLQLLCRPCHEIKTRQEVYCEY
jgi:5-methylcytosine-specific restriction endonuclease McrA